MIGAIDAVCDVAQRIIGKLQEGAAAGGPPLLGAAIAGDAGSRPPTPAMKRFADSIARKKGVKPPPGYATSGSICRAFLDQHAPKKADTEIPGASGSKPASPAQIVICREDCTGERHRYSRRSQGQFGCHVGMDRTPTRSKSVARGRRKPVNMPTKSIAPKSTAPKKRSRKPAANVAATATPSTPARENSGTDTPLRIPYGNKDAALKLGARYRAGRWYAPPGVDLAAFGERGWL